MSTRTVAGTIEVEGRTFVLVEKKKFDRLWKEAGRTKIAAMTTDVAPLPPLPPRDEEGNRNAIAFVRATIARDMIRDRRALGWSQQELARRAGVRQETVSRLENGKQTVTQRLLDKIDRVIDAAKN